MDRQIATYIPPLLLLQPTAALLVVKLLSYQNVEHRDLYLQSFGRVEC